MQDAIVPGPGLPNVGDLIAASKPLPGGWLGQQLQRLQRLLALRDAHATHLNDEGRRLLDHAIFTTFVDCRELGGEALASALLTSLDEDGSPAALAGQTPGAPAPAAGQPAAEPQGPGTDPPSR